MPLINALSLTQEVIAWLVNSHRPRILHIFDPVCNLINEHGEVLSVVTRQIGNGPFNLVIDGDTAFSRHIDADCAISIFGDRLMLGEFRINTRNGELWNPCPDWELLHLMRDRIVRSLPGFEITRPATTTMQIPSYQSLVSALCSAIVNRDISSTVSAAADLAGLGSGLTPAGDDLMLGAIYAAWIIHPADIAKSLAEAIANTAGPRTTSLSRAWLRSAARGETGILWHQLLEELCKERNSNPPFSTKLQVSVNRILRVGETSGADALSGFTGTLRCYAERARA